MSLALQHYFSLSTLVVFSGKTALHLHTAAWHVDMIWQLTQNSYEKLKFYIGFTVHWREQGNNSIYYADTYIYILPGKLWSYSQCARLHRVRSKEVWSIRPDNLILKWKDCCRVGLSYLWDNEISISRKPSPIAYFYDNAVDNEPVEISRSVSLSYERKIRCSRNG